MNQEQIQEIIDKLAVSLGTTAEHVWQILITQAQVYFVSGIFIYAFLFLGVFAYVKWGLVWAIADSKKHICEQNIEVNCSIFVIGFFLAFAVFISILFIPEWIGMGINPEYWALNEVLNVIK